MITEELAVVGGCGRMGDMVFLVARLHVDLLRVTSAACPA